MDIQHHMVAALPDASVLLKNIKKAQETARAAGIPVIFVKLGFREGYPEVSAANANFSGLKASGLFSPSDALAEIHPDVAPLPGETVIDKKRYSAFSGNDLHMILTSKGVTELVLLGISTSGIVLSTVRQAFDLDYKLTVLSDCCADRHDDVHNILISKIFLPTATVQTVDDWAVSIKA